MYIELSHTWEKGKNEQVIPKFVTNLAALTVLYCIHLSHKVGGEEGHQSHWDSQWHTGLNQVGFRFWTIPTSNAPSSDASFSSFDNQRV